MIVQELLTRLGFTVDRAGIEQGKSALNEFKSFALQLGIGAGIMLLGRQAYGTATAMEDLNIQFKTLLGSQEAAQSMMAKVVAFAAKTPYELPELASATKSLVAFGIANEKIMPTLNAVGDIAAGLKIPIGELAAIYGKAKVQGVLMSEDINQLTGRGIPVIQQFAKQLGVTDNKVKEMASKGKISFKNLEQAFVDMTSKGGQFAGMMDELSRSTSGKFSTAADNVKMALGKMAEPFLPLVRQVLDLVAAINFEPAVEFFKATAIAVQYFATTVWNSGLSTAFTVLYQTILDVLRIVGGVPDAFGGTGSALQTVALFVGKLATAFVLAASTVLQLTGYMIELGKWCIENKDLFIGLGTVMLMLFGPTMISSILGTANAIRVAAMSNLFFERAALMGGRAAGYQVTMLGLLRAAAMGVQEAFMAARAAVAAFAATTVGLMALVFAAIASVGFAVYEIWKAVQEKRELEEGQASEEKKAKIAEQILEDTKEWRRAKDRGDTATMEEMRHRINERKLAYKAIGETAKQSIEDNSFPSFDAMMQASTSKLDVQLQKSTGTAGKALTVNNNMDFTVNADSSGAGTGLTADQVAELAARAARATFQLELQTVSVGLI